MDAAVLVGGVPVGVEFSVVADEVERERLVGTRGVGLGVHHLKRARQKPGAVVVVVAARTCQQAGREQQQDILEFHGIVIYLLYLIDTWPSRFVALGTTDDLPSVPVRLAQRRRMLTDALSYKAAGRAKSKTLKPGM